MAKTKSPFAALVTADSALETIITKLRSITDTEEVPLIESDGRVLAQDIKSTINVPAFDRAAMDGFAVRSDDVDEPAMLKIIGSAFAGEAFKKTAKKGECVEVATGAPMPKGTDAVVMIENSTVVGQAVKFTHPVKPGENVGRKAEDIGKGDVVVERGTVLAPGPIAAIAIIGRDTVKVYRKPRVLIFTTGDEVVAPGKTLKQGQVYDCNSFAMMTVCQRAGADVTYRPNVKDTEKALLDAIKDASQEFDAIVFSGGTSVGAKDFGEKVLSKLGKVHVHGVAIKPGKPLLFGTIKRCGVFGMPGYPTSCLLTAKLFLAPAVRKLAHNVSHERRKKPVILGHEIKQDKTKQLLLPVRLDDQDVAFSTFKSSGAITSLSQSVGYVEVDAGDSVLPKGSEVVIRIIT